MDILVGSQEQKDAWIKEWIELSNTENTPKTLKDNA